jgi:hypothetical protein
MTLTETLRLKVRYLKYDDLRALDYCEKRWREGGSPTERWQMINFIERMLQELQQSGMGYPKVLLLRKKEIQSGQFNIRQQVAQTEPANECSCFDGWLPAGKPCPCPKGEPHRAQLRKWGIEI